MGPTAGITNTTTDHPVGARFERRHRLLQGADFKAVFNRRLRFHGTYFSFHLLEAADHQNCHRIGLAVSRKVSKRAVQRNRIKRQARESFRLFQATPDARCMDESLQPGFIDLVMVAKPAAAIADNARLRVELDRAWDRALKMAQNQKGHSQTEIVGPAHSPSSPRPVRRSET